MQMVYNDILDSEKEEMLDMSAEYKSPCLTSLEMILA